MHASPNHQPSNNKPIAHCVARGGITNLIRKILITSSIFIMLPFVMAWVRYHEKNALRYGRKLNDTEINWAKKIGITHPHKIRILSLKRIPTPIPHFIEKIIQKLGFPAGNASGMCMRYGIYTRQLHANNKSLIAHELVHTHQYERHSSLWNFLKLYLTETMMLGYANAPLEIEANNTAESTIATAHQHPPIPQKITHQ